MSEVVMSGEVMGIAFRWPVGSARIEIGHWVERPTVGADWKVLDEINIWDYEAGAPLYTHGEEIIQCVRDWAESEDPLWETGFDMGDWLSR